jgi:hypothetical protein
LLITASLAGNSLCLTCALRPITDLLTHYIAQVRIIGTRYCGIKKIIGSLKNFGLGIAECGFRGIGALRLRFTEGDSRNQGIVLVLVVVLALGEAGGKLVQNRAVNSSTTPLDSCMVSPANFDHEKLDVYQLELKFLTWATQFLADISGLLSAQTRELRDQLDCASLSALLNTAEGYGGRQGSLFGFNPQSEIRNCHHRRISDFSSGLLRFVATSVCSSAKSFSARLIGLATIATSVPVVTQLKISITSFDRIRMHP